MPPNGLAIKGGCVTRRQHRDLSCYPPTGGPENCHVFDPDRAESERHGVQGGYGEFFAPALLQKM